MRKTIQGKIEDITCDQCNKFIYRWPSKTLGPQPSNPIQLNEYYRNDLESERHLCSVECLVTYLIDNPHDFEGIYQYYLSFPSGAYLGEFTRYLGKRIKNE